MVFKFLFIDPAKSGEQYLRGFKAIGYKIHQILFFSYSNVSGFEIEVP